MTDIKLYTLSTCVFCKRLKKFLSQNGFEFDYIDVDILKGKERQKILDEVKELNPRVSFPTAVINGKVAVGFKESEIRRLLGL
jgi:glutaredoxin-like protein NrdH